MLAKWLAKVCLDVAIRNPDDEHAQFLDFAIGLPTSASSALIVFLVVPKEHDKYLTKASGSCVCQLGSNEEGNVSSKQ